MISLLARLTFFAAVIATLAFFLLGQQQLNIDTNLNDLNPDKVTDNDLKSALQTVNEAVSQRFIVVLEGSQSRLNSAKADIQRELNALPALSVVTNEQLQANYLTALTPYRFNLLTAGQRQQLKTHSPERLASDAQRRLYQLGEGVRVIPFDRDPLGWFSDFVLSGLDNLDNTDSEAPTSASPVVSLVVNFDRYPKDMAQQAQLYRTINQIESTIAKQYQVRVLHSGMFFFAVDSAQSAKADIQLIAVGSTIGVLVLMLLVFRSLLPLLLSLSSIAIGVGFGVLVSIFQFGSVHILTIVFGASLIGIVVDYSLHYFYHSLSQHPVSRHAASSHSSLFRAMLLSVLTSVIGYGALGLSDLVILKKVALFSCTGLAMAWVSVMVLGPLVIRRPIAARQRALRQVIHACQQVFARRPRLLVSVGLLLGCASGIYALTGNIATNDDPRRFFHVSPSLLSQEQQVASRTQVYEPGRYLMVQGASDDAVFTALEQLYAALGEQQQSLSSILDWLPSPARQRENYARQAKLYAEGMALDQFAARLGLPATQFTAVKAQYQQADNRVLSVPALLEELPSLPPLWIAQSDRIYSVVLIRKNSDLDKIAAAADKITGVQYINTLASASEALKAQRETGAMLLLLAYALIAVLLMLYYRRLKAVCLLLIPLVASAVTLAAVSLLGQSITVFHVMALFLVLGLGMDYIIFAKEMQTQRAVTQQAILLSAVTSLLSFGLLAFSSMPIVQAFGSTILIGNTINFIAAISLFNGPQRTQEKRPDVG